MLSGTNDHHPNTHIERPKHFVVSHIAQLLHEPKDQRLGPSPAVDLNGNTFGQNAWDVLKKAAAGDVCKSFDNAAVEQFIELRQKALMRSEQCLADSRAQFI